MRRAALVIAILAALLPAAFQAQAAALALVLAIDVSKSVSPDSYVLQHDGIARAFENPQLVDAIANTPGGIEVLGARMVRPGQDRRQCRLDAD